MLITSLIIWLSVLAPMGVEASNAPKVKKNPKNIVAIADFPFGMDKNVKGNIVFSAKEGKAVQVHVDMTGLPLEGGPFFYHIHENSIPGNGNCEAAGLHFNPYGASPDCSIQKDDSRCQIGDLSGKHGWINTTCFEDKFEDSYLSLNKKSKAYIIGKSIVFHFANLSKFACADIEYASDLRISSLIEEYKANNDLIDVQDFEQVTELDYQFNEDEGLEYEIYELSAQEQQEQQLQQQNHKSLEVFQKESEDLENVVYHNIEFYKNSTTNFTSPLHNFTNGTNHTNLTSNQYSGDFESSAASLIKFGITTLFAACLGLLI
ncbi:superoxide dismutase [Scheffersomyces amazonensis]|uniref:superoxide dismutase n=1 Tax=Scheffersomyces amazonensis TaxID=1078765 RepID=UPI00315D4F56